MTTTATLEDLLAAFNDHDLDRITWLLTGTTPSGETVRVRGCDLFDLDKDGRILRKDSYWKIVT